MDLSMLNGNNGEGAAGPLAVTPGQTNTQSSLNLDETAERWLPSDINNDLASPSSLDPMQAQQAGKLDWSGSGMNTRGLPTSQLPSMEVTQPSLPFQIDRECLMDWGAYATLEGFAPPTDPIQRKAFYEGFLHGSAYVRGLLCANLPDPQLQSHLSQIPIPHLPNMNGMNTMDLFPQDSAATPQPGSGAVAPPNTETQTPTSANSTSSNPNSSNTSNATSNPLPQTSTSIQPIPNQPLHTGPPPANASPPGPVGTPVAANSSTSSPTTPPASPTPAPTQPLSTQPSNPNGNPAPTPAPSQPLPTPEVIQHQQQAMLQAANMGGMGLINPHSALLQSQCLQATAGILHPTTLAGQMHPPHGPPHPHSAGFNGVQQGIDMHAMVEGQMDLHQVHAGVMGMGGMGGGMEHHGGMAMSSSMQQMMADQMALEMFGHHEHDPFGFQPHHMDHLVEQPLLVPLDHPGRRGKRNKGGDDGWEVREVEPTRLRVRCSPLVTEEELNLLFAQHGEVWGIRKHGRSSKAGSSNFSGAVFVRMGNSEQARRAKDALNGKIVGGAMCYVALMECDSFVRATTGCFAVDRDWPPGSRLLVRGGSHYTDVELHRIFSPFGNLDHIAILSSHKQQLAQQQQQAARGASNGNRILTANEVGGASIVPPSPKEPERSGERFSAFVKFERAEDAQSALLRSKKVLPNMAGDAGMGELAGLDVQIAKPRLSLNRPRNNNSSNGNNNGNNGRHGMDQMRYGGGSMLEDHPIDDSQGGSMQAGRGSSNVAALSTSHAYHNSNAPSNSGNSERNNGRRHTGQGRSGRNRNNNNSNSHSHGNSNSTSNNGHTKGNNDNDNTDGTGNTSPNTNNNSNEGSATTPTATTTSSPTHSNGNTNGGNGNGGTHPTGGSGDGGATETAPPASPNSSGPTPISTASASSS